MYKRNAIQQLSGKVLFVCIRHGARRHMRLPCVSMHTQISCGNNRVKTEGQTKYLKCSKVGCDGWAKIVGDMFFLGVCTHLFYFRMPFGRRQGCVGCISNNYSDTAKNENLHKQITSQIKHHITHARHLTIYHYQCCIDYFSQSNALQLQLLGSL